MTHTQNDFRNIEFLLSGEANFEATFKARAFRPWSEEVVTFLEALSARLLKDDSSKSYPDVVSFAFWCRSGALRKLKERYSSPRLTLGRGILFHIAPSNVPVNFAYSLAGGLLTGNANIVRVPSKEFPQVSIISSAISRLLDQSEFSFLRHHVVLVRYEKNSAITDYLSAHCDVRIIWGGDRTIEEIRRSPLPPRSFDLNFADRYSICAINAEAYLTANEQAHMKLAKDFYNDTYLFDQNACTAPHLVVWLGTLDQVRDAQVSFWKYLHKVVSDQYQFQAISGVDKFTDSYRFAASFEKCHIQKMTDNLIVRVVLDELRPGLENARSTCGLFYEYHAEKLDDILPVINRKFQTMAYYGVDPGKLQDFIHRTRPTGIDRMVPIGRTLDFSLLWDGYDLPTMLTRSVFIPEVTA